MATNSGDTQISGTDICFRCPDCGQHLSVEERGAGMLVNCPSCNQQIDVPRLAAPVKRIVDKESEAAAGVRPFEIQKVRERSVGGERCATGDSSTRVEIFAKIEPSNPVQPL